MAVERFANLGETTLASSYTSGGTTLSVTSASLFPSGGVFAVGLGNVSRTVWRVDSVSGSTFTGAAEEFDGNASAGDTVTLIGSKRVAERFLQSPTSLGAPSGTSGANRYGPIYQIGDPTAFSWGWVNQGTASVVESGEVILLIGVNDSVQNDRLRTKSHTASKRYRALLKYDIFQNNGTTIFSYAGLAFRESSTGKFIRYIAQVGTSNVIAAQNMTNPTTFGTTLTSETRNCFYHAQEIWQEVEDNNTNLIFRYSLDGVNFYTTHTVARTTHMSGGPNEVGFMIGAVGSPGVARVTVKSWLEF